MRGLIIFTTLVGISCSGPAGPADPLPTRQTLAARTQARPRTQSPAPAPARKAVRPRPRPRRWVAQLQGRVKATAGATGQVTALVAASTALVSVTREARKTWLRGWDTKTRKALWKLEAPARRVELALAADGKSMVVTTPGGTNHIYQLSGGQPKLYRKWKRKRGRKKGRSQGLSADGSMLIRGDVRGQVRGYTLDKYKMKWLVKAERVVMSRDGKIASVFRGKSVRMLDAVTGRASEPALALAGRLIDFAAHSHHHGAYVVEQGGKCKLTGGSFKARPVVCIPQMKLAWSPGAKLLGIAGQSVARIVSRSPHKVLSEHTSRAKAPLRVVFPTDKTFVVANEPEGRLSFYRLIKR